MVSNHILVAVLWIVFGVLHSVLASGSVKDKVREKTSEKFKFYRPAYVLFFFVLMTVIILFQSTMRQILLVHPSRPILISGILICLTGLVLMILCIQKYFFSLSGLKSIFIQQPTSTLLITGIHRHVRHPLYLGTFLFIWGLLLLLPYCSLLISNVIITVYTIAGIRWEENKLIQEFGESYLKYKKEVPKILPFFKTGS